MPLSNPSFSAEEGRRLTEVLQSGWWTYGPITREIEASFAEYLGVKHALAVSSGTAALHLAHLALETGAGDEVILPSLNFVAASNIILHTGGLPRFADVHSLDRPLISTESIERALTQKTRGICVMHYGGYPCAMDEIMEFAGRRGLWVIEDAAHAPGAAWSGVKCGAWGDIGCFSFFGNKNLTCAEGGLVVTQRDDLAEKLRRLRSHGMTSLTWDRFRGHQAGYDVTVPGFNYRMDDLRAAILGVQLRSLENLNRQRKVRVDWYRQRLGEDSRWILPFRQFNGESAHHLFVIALDESISRDRVIQKMRSRGVQTSVHYPPTHLFTFYRKMLREPTDLKITEDAGRRLLTLPLYPELTMEQVNLVCSALQEAAEG